ncbi:DUF599 domain-containing protein [Chelatococcus sambhunathii]|uniref:DUF599 domain-containing protein n=1 Tax=Chelatococcus sambhunathii TaxID=363953 RepID=A0ABU1DDY6_9HYPH|nr:DUF599 domain-containing protein [Chelatococcus sambhunathii]MDR4306155.1 DUF599 domain-containing protein [Chelatococcus sambhunathii]
MTNVFSPLDLVALGVFLAAWIGHHFHSELSPKSLNAIMAKRRRNWMERMARRDARMPDSIAMQGLQNGAAFFASTSLIAIGGGLAALRASDQAVQVFASLPFGIETTVQLYDVKALGFSAIFVYAFFKFVWAYRLFNYCSILVVSAPPPQEAGTPQMAVAIERAARMNIEAGRHFNRGLRALFFVLAYLGWFVSPYVLIGASLAVLVVLYRRQFASEPVSAASLGD